MASCGESRECLWDRLGPAWLMAVLMAMLIGASGDASAQDAAKPTDIKRMLFCVPGLPGSSTSAQPYIDKMLARLAEELGEASGTLTGKFELDPKRCREQIKTGSIQIALLAPALYANLRTSIQMRVVARVAVSGRSDEKYFVVARRGGPKRLEDLGGRLIVGTQAYDPKYVARLLFGGALKPTDLTLKPVKRPLKAVRDVARGQAEAAIIDVETFAALPELPEAVDLQLIHTSAVMPPPAVVVIGMGKKESKRFQQALLELCRSESNAQMCGSLMISSIQQGSDGDYRSFVRQYTK